jgi:hypothetical protein
MSDEEFQADHGGKQEIAWPAVPPIRTRGAPNHDSQAVIADWAV